MYTYPEALNAMEKIAFDLLHAACPNVTWNVRVVADSVTGTASVDWSASPLTSTWINVTINMPIRKAVYRMSADEFAHWAAYLLHEVGHPLETDKVEWKAAVAAGRHRLLNALEDVREELCTIRRGIANNALKVFSSLVDMLHAKAVAEGYDPNEPNSIGWTISTLGRKANGYEIDVRDIHAKLDPNGIVGTVVPWALADLAACQSTADCRALSDKIIGAVNAAMKAERDAEPELDATDIVPPQGKPEPTGGMSENRESEDEFVEPEPEPQPDTSPVIPGDEQADDSMHGRVEDREEDEEAKPEEEDLFRDEDIDVPDMRPTDRDDIVSSGQDAYTQRRLTALLRRTIVKDASELSKRPITGRAVSWTGTMSTVDYVIANASKMGRQRALLAKAMKANDIDSYEGGRLNGRLDRRVVHKLATGTSNAVFGLRTSSEGYDTDVQIIVDGSGSMSGNRILAAASLALVVAQAASQVGVDCAAHVFTDDGLTMATTGRAKPIGRKFGYMFNQIKGGTPLTENLLLAAHLQHKRASGKRRVLFVITDGDCDQGADCVKAAGQYVESLGTEIANLHIGRVAMGLFRNEVAVNAHDVSTVGLKQLTAVLERGAN